MVWHGRRMAAHLICVSNNWVHLASGSLQFCKASVEVIKILDDHLPCCQPIGESNLSKNLLQNRVGETPNIYVLKCCIVTKADSAREHLELNYIVLCHGSRCHFMLMKLCTSHPCPIWVSKSLFDVLRKMSKVCI